MSSLVNLSEGSSLAFHGLAIVAIRHPERVTVKYLANVLNASEAHMAKIFQRLNKAGYVKSLRGPSGGFVLTCESDDLSLLDIYEAIEGKITMQACPLGKEKCRFSRCIFGDRLAEISKDIYDMLKSIKLSAFFDNIKICKESTYENN